MSLPRPHNLAATRCRNHPDREAVAFCRECAQAFCRECVVEHEGRMICNTCLRELLEQPVAPPPARRWTRAALWLFSLSGLVVAWILFSFMGRALISLRAFADGWIE